MTAPRSRASSTSAAARPPSGPMTSVRPPSGTESSRRLVGSRSHATRIGGSRTSKRPSQPTSSPIWGMRPRREVSAASRAIRRHRSCFVAVSSRTTERADTNGTMPPTPSCVTAAMTCSLRSPRRMGIASVRRTPGSASTGRRSTTRPCTSCASTVSSAITDSIPFRTTVIRSPGRRRSTFAI